MILELRRILCSRTTLGVLLISLLLNGILFYRQQQIEEFGFSSYTSEVYERFYGAVEPEEYLRAYDKLYDLYMGADMEAAIAEVRQLTQLYESISEFQTVLDARSTVPQKEWESETFADYRLIYDTFMLQYPDAAEAVTNDFSAFRAQVYVDSVAAQKLLMQLAYLGGYSSYLDGIQNNAEKLQRFSALSNRFDGKFIEKTAADFSALDGVSVALCRDGAVSSLFSSQITDYILILLLVYFALCCLRERQDGLWAVIHSQPRGRGQLAVQRLAVLLICVITCISLLYGSDLLIGFWLYGGGFWDIAAQSISLFQRFTVSCTVTGLLLRFYCMRILTGFTLAVLIFLLLSATRRDKLMLAILAIVAVIEYSMYTLLPARSVWNVLKYVNLFSLVHISELFSSYVNLNVLGTPVTARHMVAIVSLVLTAIWSIGVILLHQYMQPYGKNQKSFHILDLTKRLESAICSNLNGLELECYKAIILQRGWMILLAFIVLTVSIDQAAPVPRTAADDYYAQLSGPVTAETQATITEWINANEEEMRIADELQAQWKSGMISFDAYFAGMSKYIDSYDRAQVLVQVQDRLTYLMDASDEKARLWMLDSTSFDGIFSSYAADVQIEKALLFLAAVCLLLSGLITMERQAGMTELLRSTLNGRRNLLTKQYGLMVLIVVPLSLLQSAVEIAALLQTDAVSYLSAPVQSISWLEFFPLKLSISGFLAFVSICRIIGAISIGCILLWLSGRLSNVRMATFFSIGILLGPTIMYYYIGVTPFKWLSVAIPISVYGLIWNDQGSLKTMGFMGGVLIIISTALSAWSFQANQRRASM